MRTLTRKLEDLKSGAMVIGFVGENQHTRIIFDAGVIYSEYPHAAASLTVRMDGIEPYPVAVTRDEDTVIWDVLDSSLTREGYGEIQMAFTAGEVIVKTYIGQIRVLRSIIPTGEIPDPLDDFLTAAGAALTAIPETIDAALESAMDHIDGAVEQADQDAVDAVAAKNAAVAAKGAAETAQGKAETAQGKAEDAQRAAEAAQGAAEQAKTNAAGSARDAAASEVNAGASAASAAGSAESAYRDAERAEQAANTAGYMWIEMDENGHLIYTRTDAVDVDFFLDNNGHLIMEV